ncbi:MAG TPA: energy-coupling factor ABC transporter permease, partial [Candidatus Krumholzibacteria bacterium]|nr:energy-coupling factor ABC transporter permease [Candidatus Krumholzibacteria bacterium]
VIFAATRLRSAVTRERLIKAAIGAAVVFVAQMYDVPLFGAVKVHPIGAAFLTLLAGPELALMAMAAVIASQALFMHDGGVAEMGANILNMGVAGVAAATLTLRLVQGRIRGTSGLLMAAALASVTSVMAAVGFMSLELALSGTPALSAFGLTMPAHAGFAAWETLTTAALVLAAVRMRAIEPVAAASVS